MMDDGTIFGVDSRWAYTALILAVVAERLVELVLTKRNARRLRARGGVEAGRSHYPWMVALHTGILIAAPAEVWLRDRPLVPALAAAAFVALLLTMALRYWAITTLGDRWTTQVFVVPGEAPVAAGPYRHLRHPNYLAVVVEVAALPLVHTAWWTALLGSFGNALVLRRRIRSEEAALAEAADYSALASRPRLVPFTRPAPTAAAESVTSEGPG